MSDHIYKHIELTGTSTEGMERAIQNAITKVGETSHNIRWFQVTETRGAIDNKQVSHWQVTLKIGFTLD